MKFSNIGLKRARPAFGTILTLEVAQTDAAASNVLSRAFSLAEELEARLSKFQVDSDLCRLNAAMVGAVVPVHEDFARLLNLSLEIYAQSGGGFSPFVEAAGQIELQSHGDYWLVRKHTACQLDTSGIAKGYSVDRLCELLMKELPGVPGVVNAGGDMRFFNYNLARQFAVRSTGQTSSLRLLRTDKNAVATSSFNECRHNPLSTTVYRQSPRADLHESFSVTVLANECMIADALTKAGWFSGLEQLKACAKFHNAQVLIFTESGGEHARIQ